jgi:multidrug resistance efflux pump
METNMPSNETNAVLAKEEEILHEEKEILKEIKSEEKEIKKTEKRVTILVSVLVAAVVFGAGGILYWQYSSNRIQIDKASIDAPRIDLGPAMAGTLQELDVHEGDVVLPDTVVARVDTQSIKTKIGGLIVAVENNIGKRVAPNEAVVSLIDPHALRVMGQLEEDKGLQDVQLGQRAVFTVDAFGSRKFYGTVDSISPTSQQAGIVFSISDKRETKIFDIKVRFNTDEYPELKSGMSAKITILKN